MTEMTKSHSDQEREISKGFQSLRHQGTDTSAASKQNHGGRLLTELPDDVLFLVFDRCDIESLGRLCQVCKKLNSLLQSDSVWLKFSRLNLCIGSSDLGRCVKRPKKSLKEQIRVSTRWLEKKNTENVLFRNSTRLMPWMQFVDGNLWISTQNIIQCYNVCEKSRPKERKKQRLTLPNSHHTHDVTRFVVKNGTLVSGCRDGSLYIFDCENGQCVQALYQLHDTDTQAVDFHDSVIVSGSRDNTVKIISRNNTRESCHQPIRAVHNMRERVWSLSVSPNQSCFTVGTSGCRGSPSLSVWDIERGSMLTKLGDYRYGAGVLDMKYEDENTLLSCGYDATLRMWDLRSGKCACEWPEPYDSTLYSLQTDHNFTMVTGSAQHGMVRLWDKRHTESIQEYFFSQKSPVYSVAFDSRRLFAALDLSINYMDFSSYSP